MIQYFLLGIARSVVGCIVGGHDFQREYSYYYPLRVHVLDSSLSSLWSAVLHRSCKYRRWLTVEL